MVGLLKVGWPSSLSESLVSSKPAFVSLEGFFCFFFRLPLPYVFLISRTLIRILASIDHSFTPAISSFKLISKLKKITEYKT